MATTKKPVDMNWNRNNNLCALTCPEEQVIYDYCKDEGDDDDVDDDEYYDDDDDDMNDDDDDHDHLPPGATPAFTRFHLARRFWNQIFTCAPIVMTMKIRITIIMMMMKIRITIIMMMMMMMTTRSKDDDDRPPEPLTVLGCVLFDFAH